MVQKLQCCSKSPDYLITYSVSGSEKGYLVCSECIKKECFSKYIIRRHILENNKKIFKMNNLEQMMNRQMFLKLIMSIPPKVNMIMNVEDLSYEKTIF